MQGRSRRQVETWIQEKENYGKWSLATIGDRMTYHDKCAWMDAKLSLIKVDQKARVLIIINLKEMCTREDPEVDQLFLKDYPLFA